MSNSLDSLVLFNDVVLGVYKAKKKGVPYGGGRIKMTIDRYEQIRILAAEKAAKTRGKNAVIRALNHIKNHDDDKAIKQIKAIKDILDSVKNNFIADIKHGNHGQVAQGLKEFRDAFENDANAIGEKAKKLKKKVKQQEQAQAQAPTQEDGEEKPTDESSTAEEIPQTVKHQSNVANGLKDVYDLLQGNDTVTARRMLGNVVAPQMAAWAGRVSGTEREVLQGLADEIAGLADSEEIDIEDIKEIRHHVLQHIAAGSGGGVDAIFDNMAAQHGEGVSETTEVKPVDRYAASPISDAPWEGKIEQIEKALMSKEVNRRINFTWKNVNAAFRDTMPDGSEAIVKPDYLGQSVASLRPEHEYHLRGDVPVGVREALAFSVDRALGLGVVPPTIYKKITLEGDMLKAGLAKAQEGVNHGDYVHNLLKNPKLKDKLASIKNGDAEGSAQFFVKNAKEFHKTKKTFNDLSAKHRADVLKIAVLDYVCGNVDRHGGNFLYTKNRMVAIDHGLCFPDNYLEAKENIGHLNRFRSRPFYDVVNNTDGAVPEPILKQLQKVDKDSLMKLFKERDMDGEGEGVWWRIQDVIKRGKLSKTMVAELTY